MKSDLPGDFSKSRSNVNLTSAEVSSWPSWKVTPCRSLKVHASPSGLICQDSASSGTGFISASKRTSWLYIIGERRLRENAGTSCGSRPVASVVCAETKSEEHTSELQSLAYLVCRLLLEKKKNQRRCTINRYDSTEQV